MKIKIFCDFDGTITRQDTTDAVLETFARPEYKDWERKWEEGTLSARECMRQQTRLIQAGPETLRSFLIRQPIDPGIHVLKKECVKNGASLVIVSDGIDFLMKAVLRVNGLDHLPHYSNRLHWEEDGRPTLTFPYGDAVCQGGCGVCKCRLLEQDGRQEFLTVYIGDGLSDRCVVHRADRVFAKKRLRAYCMAKGIVHDSFETLTEVARALFGEPSRLKPAIQEKR
ncbi:MAG TPA: MtnX-like HAD-IB family phosphatase [Nitrospiria bacterium]|nr:MtnX-like HAD-IB family phosphatase [Nitrospiria bacterium]